MRDGVKCESESLEYPLGGADVVGVVVVVGRQVGEREKEKNGEDKRGARSRKFLSTRDESCRLHNKMLIYT